MFTKQSLTAALVLLGAGACSYGGSEPVAVTEQEISNAPGIDVSQFQGAINWSQVKAAGTQFAFIKSGGMFPSGNTYTDPNFATNWSQARSAGVIRGAYYYFQPAFDGVTQGNSLVSQINAAGGLQPGDLPPVIDIELNAGNTVWDPVTANNVAHLQQWLTTVQNAFGKKPYIYTNQSTWSFMGNPQQFSGYPLWVANPERSTPLMPLGGWPTWTFWQYHVEQGPLGSIVGMPQATGLDHDYYTGSCDNGVAVGGTACASQGDSVQYRCLFGSTPGASLWSAESCNGGTCSGSSCTGGGGGSCPYATVQARVQQNIQQPWAPAITINLGQSFTVGAFHDSLDQFVTCCTSILVTGPGGFTASPANDSVITPTVAGDYNVHVACGSKFEDAHVTVQGGGGGSCSCSGGSTFWHTAIPASDTSCGFRVCGGDNQLYSCQSDGWHGIGGTPCNCRCTNGVDSQGHAINPDYTYCGFTVCGADHQHYTCGASGWSAQHDTCQ